MPIPFEQIKSIARQIGEQFNPTKVVLFGSYAWGTPTDDSDLDLLVIMSEVKGHPVKIAGKIRHSLPRGIAIDVMVRDPEFVEYRVKNSDGFFSNIAKNGKVLWEATRAV